MKSTDTIYQEVTILLSLKASSVILGPYIIYSYRAIVCAYKVHYCYLLECLFMSHMAMDDGLIKRANNQVCKLYSKRKGKH
jgi:hypothetical protein